MTPWSIARSNYTHLCIIVKLHSQVCLATNSFLANLSSQYMHLVKDRMYCDAVTSPGVRISSFNERNKLYQLPAHLWPSHVAGIGTRDRGSFGSPDAPSH